MPQDRVCVVFRREVLHEGKVHDTRRIDRGLFVGKDQTMWNAIMYLFPKNFITVWANDPETMPGKNRGEGAGDCGGWCVSFRLFLSLIVLNGSVCRWGYYVYWYVT